MPLAFPGIDATAAYLSPEMIQVLNAAGQPLEGFDPAKHLFLFPAVAGADGFFLETHPDPARALSDAATQWPLDRLDQLLGRTLELWARAHD